MSERKTGSKFACIGLIPISLLAPMFETMRAKEKISITANGNSIYEQESLNENT